jgi:hypothetical protein
MAAETTISGNGTSRKKMPTKDKPASVTVSLFFSTLFPMRRTASITTARTAGLSPKKTHCTMLKL